MLRHQGPAASQLATGPPKPNQRRAAPLSPPPPLTRPQIGDRVPRYVKLLQGALLFSALLLCIWLPLLLFSSGAPTFQTPAVAAAEVNASFVAASARGDYSGMMSFPVFSSAFRRTAENWVRPAAADDSGGGGGGGAVVMPRALAAYAPDQVKLICTAQVRSGDLDLICCMIWPDLAARSGGAARRAPASSGAAKGRMVERRVP